MTLYIVPVVEGQTEQGCVERLLHRVWHELVGQPDGLTVWNVTNKIPLFDPTGTVIGTAGITRRLDTPGQATASGTDAASTTTKSAGPPTAMP